MTTEIEGKDRWYCVARQGWASLCPDEADARQEAINFDRYHPEDAPHRAVRLVDAAEVERILSATVDHLRAARRDVLNAGDLMKEELDRARAEAEALRADAERYRWLRRKVCIISNPGPMRDPASRYASFEIRDLPWPTHIAPDPGREFDFSIDSAAEREAISAAMEPKP